MRINVGFDLSGDNTIFYDTTFNKIYACIYQVGQSYLNAEQATDNRILLSQLQKQLDVKVLQYPYCLLQECFQVDVLSMRVLVLNMAFAREPDLLQDFTRLAPYEQGPLLSLERSVLLCQSSGSIKSNSVQQYLSSGLNQWKLCAPLDQQCSGRLMQSLIIADGVWEFLQSVEGGGGINLSSLLPLQFQEINLTPQLKIAHGLYESQLSDSLPALLCIEGLNADDRLSYVKAQCSRIYDGKRVCFDIVEMQFSSDLTLDSFNDIISRLACAYLYARENQQPFFCYWSNIGKYRDQWPAIRSLIAKLTMLENAYIIISDTENYPYFEHKRILKQLKAADRKKCWQTLAQCRQETLTEQELSLISALYPLNGEQFQRAVVSLADDTGQSFLPRLQQVCLAQLSVCDGSLATHCLPRYSLADMQLTDDIQTHLQSLITRMQYSGEMTAILPHYRPGIQALFWGKPGTGKSMAAEALAKELHLPLYKVNLANVASKWIGESEKQLANLFDQAEAQNAVLLFDEADAIFSKRSEVESSHDKNANMGVSYLLQRMEDYSALLLLSTNFKHNIDDAFLRRFDAVIEFTLPDSRRRLNHWKKLSTNRPGFDEQIDIGTLAEGFELSIAQIDNVYQQALLSALQVSGPIQKEQLLQALKRELAKEQASLLSQQQLQNWL